MCLEIINSTVFFWVGGWVQRWLYNTFLGVGVGQLGWFEVYIGWLRVP